MTPVNVTRGDGPLVLAYPHAGTFLPAEVRDALGPLGRELADTDWHVDRLYAGLVEGATHVRANFHRYVVDANRDPAGASLYPGQNTTTLVPVTSFDGENIWDHAPGERDVAERLAAWHAPYHAALAAEIERVRSLHGVAILFDCHSIRSHIPFLFDGRLPDFNVGTNSGASCAPELERIVAGACGDARGFTHVVNGRFKGGWTTRHYGRPARGVHAIQLELSQATYLAAEAAPFTYDPSKADAVRNVLGPVLHALAEAAPALAASKGLHT